MNETIVNVRVNFWSGLLGSTGLYASSCVLPVYVAGQRRSSPSLMLGPLVLSSRDGPCGGRRSLLLRSDLSSALDVMQRHTHTPVLTE